ncbi:hypothetical protein [Streptomyces sp. BE230]|uniref:hypothetical protein n=1 Tax=Streptomyces sp. BE230 TaxID=3002526 RepID=UPI002ED55C26|nr:hypothetical protein [Streptomyces sp. BE230]
MSIITTATALLADIAVETDRTDAVQAFVKQETILVEITSADGLRGTGYSYTIGTGGTSVLALLQDHLLPLLVGEDARNVEGLWQRLFASTRSTTTGAITSLALAAVDTALWDLRCKRAGEPLWRLAGGHRREVPVYDTEGGWLHLSPDDLVKSALRAQQAGWAGVTIKVGKPHIAAVPNGKFVEYIPQLRAVTRTEMTVRDGMAVAPDEPGIGIDWDMDAIDNRRVP